MSFEHLAVEHDEGVVCVRLNRPAQRNALSSALMRELTAYARDARRRSELRAVILSGGAAVFSAGYDLAESAARLGDPQPPSLLQQRELLALGPDLCQAWEEIEAITLAAIEGPCLGGACALALACDFRIAAANASIRLPEVPLGMNMSWQSLPRLAALIGPARAKRFTIFGEAPDPATLLQWGLVDEVVPAGAAEAKARDWAERLRQLPPLPVRMTKEAINAAAMPLRQATSVMDRDQFLLTAQTEDMREGVRAFFEKRPPRFTGR
jgi:enoyl-CoA hydratase/carnithine racemase